MRENDEKIIIGVDDEENIIYIHTISQNDAENFIYVWMMRNFLYTQMMRKLLYYIKSYILYLTYTMYSITIVL